ncbi:MAG TPA: SurA N-terminal domain-containing protein [Thermodesulfobacteriota bacterium]|nr:SurA N-terminal domain-containing protein [Thermodesulfobacteriota bacterium]
MLRILREHASSWMLKGILVLVAVSFISWGGYSYFREKKVTYAAQVNGVTIGAREYYDALQTEIKQYREALGPSFSEKMVEELHLKDKTLDGLIDKILIIQEAKRLGLSVSDEELREAIESIPAFQENGQFDNRRYEWFLRSNRMTPEEFEQSQRENLLISKVVSLIKLNEGKVSDEEVLDTYLFENERINLVFLKIVPDSLKSQVNANEVEIKDYYQKHQEEFRIPTLVQAQYLLFRPSDFERKVQISLDEAKRFYDSRKDTFKIPKQVRIRDILVKLEPQDTPDKIEAKKKKAEEILEKAKKTKDFASLAKQYSEAENASKGGDLGWIQKEMLGEQLESILFKMKAGDLSGVLAARDGFHIFKVEEVKEEKLKPFDAVKDQILLSLEKEKAKAEASRKADDAFYSLFRSRDLEGYSKEKDIPIKTTGLFKEGDEIPDIGKNPLFYSSASSLRLGEISPVVNIPPNFYILKLLSKKDSRVPPLNEVKEEVTRRVVEIKAEEKARQVAEELLNQIRMGKNIREVAREKGYPAEETGFFTRAAGVVPKIGPAREWMGILASLTDKNPVPKEIIHTNDGYFVVRLSGYEPADQSKFQSVKKNLEKQLSSRKQQEALQNWLDQLRSKAKIDKNKDILKG